MKIGINASRARSGGARAHLIGILQGLDPARFGIEQVHVWSYQGLLDELPKASWLHVHSPTALEGSLATQLAWERWTLPGELARTGCDVLMNVDAGSVCRFRPCVTMSQDMLSYEPGEMDRWSMSLFKLRLIALLYVQNAALRHADVALFLTDYARKVIGASAGRMRAVSVIPHGIPDRFRAIENRPWPEPGAEINCLYISPLWLFKHQWIVVEALAMLRKQGIPVRLTLAGGAMDDARRRLDAAIARFDPNGEFVCQMGQVAPDALPGLMRDSDLFVFASSCENMPITLLEGMAAGLPIVSSDRGPMPEVLGDAGVYCDPEDPVSVADAIRSLISDAELRTAVAHRARERALQFTWQRCSDETFALLADTARAARGQR